ncbi:2Fe-2S iron-sulfur cluster-binding protein [Sphingobium sp. EM0848]|uniref:2Fe-2S iron-sulfur cluster-binding protein n=1 Tax=Sphingobium sp. EM0848 TaxID=2743473 RepID=UPI00159CA159|nr:2Fe-2S iron-sulfur cluster-binding protein [Sphingobium sp. EM0848]
MPMIHIALRDGRISSINVEEGLSIMEGIRSAGVDELLALCGGCCSCATCHIYVQDDWSDHFTPPSADEDELLESSSSRLSASRLACQLIVDRHMEGLSFTIAPED